MQLIRACRNSKPVIWRSGKEPKHVGMGYMWKLVGLLKCVPRPGLQWARQIGTWPVGRVGEKAIVGSWLASSCRMELWSGWDR